MSRQMTETQALEPSAIYADIDSYPPLMRQEAKEKYIGREVDWLLAFFNGSVEKGRAHLSFHCESRIMQLVGGTISLSDYPWLKSLRADEVVRVRGRISGIDPMTIKLDQLELSLPEAASL